MRARISALLLLTLLALPAPARALCNWSEREATTARRFYVLLSIDIAQTHYFLDHGREELNPLLGDHPSHTRVNLAGLAAAGFFTGVSCMLSGDARRHWHGLAVFVEGVAVTVNFLAHVAAHSHGPENAPKPNAVTFLLRF